MIICVSKDVERCRKETAMFGKLLKKTFGRKRDKEEVIQEPKPVGDEKPAKDAPGTTPKHEDCPKCKAGEPCSHDHSHDKGEEAELPRFIDIPPDDRDNKVLIRNGYDKVRETAPKKFVIQTCFPAPTLENPKRIARKTAEIYGFSSLYAIKMIGWKPKKCVVVSEELREVAKDASKDASKEATVAKPTEVELAVLVAETQEKLTVPADMQWKHIIREAKKLPKVKEALEGRVVIDVKGVREKDAPSGTLRFVLRDLPKKTVEEVKPPAEEKPADEATAEEVVAVEIEETNPAPEETVAEAGAPVVESTVQAVVGNRKSRRAQKNAEAAAKKAEAAVVTPTPAEVTPAPVAEEPGVSEVPKEPVAEQAPVASDAPSS
jgi:hypothetical protein